MTDPITPLTPAEAAAVAASVPHQTCVHRDLVAIDITVNVLTGGNEDETISSRMARWDADDKGIRHAVGKAVSEALDKVEGNHGAKAVEADVERAREVIAIEQASGIVPNPSL